MSKIINTLKKGTAKARLVIILTILSCLAALVFIALAAVFRQLLYFFGTVLCAFIAISLKQTLDVYEYMGNLYGDEASGNGKGSKEETEEEFDDTPEVMDDEEPYGDTNEVEPQDTEYPDSDETYDNASANDEADSTDSGDETADTGDDTDVASLLSKMNDLLDAADVNYNDEDEDMEELAEIIAETSEEAEETHKHKHKHKRKRKNKEDKTPSVKNPDKGKLQEDILEDELDKDLKFLKTNISGDYSEEADEDEKSKKLLVVKPVSDEMAASYDKKKIKRTLHKYKVKKDHRLVIIDHCERYYIKETPAYIWKADKEFHILLIEEEPRHLVLPLYGIKEITYLKKYPANVDTDYPVFHKKTLLTDTFRPYLPDYTQSTVMTDLTSYKNLYGFGPGIYCTNRSAKNLFDLLSVDFRVDDKVTTSNKVNIYFKECYKSGILLRDNVIDANGYADMISRSLDDMAKSTISNNEFKETLNLLVRNKIITKEFSDHYMDVRNGMTRS